MKWILDRFKNALVKGLENVIEYWIISLMTFLFLLLVSSMYWFKEIVINTHIPLWIGILLIPGNIGFFILIYIYFIYPKLGEVELVRLSETLFGVGWDLTKEFFDVAEDRRFSEFSEVYVATKLILGPYCPQCKRDIKPKNWDSAFKTPCKCGKEFPDLNNKSAREVYEECYDTFKAKLKKGGIKRLSRERK